MNMTRRLLILICLFVTLTGAYAALPEAHKTAYDYSLVSLDGKEVPLSVYKGKTLLIVNLASHSIYGSQLASLQELQNTYAERGLVVLGIPSDDFGKEEPSDNAAIKNFYMERTRLTFPVFSKSSLRGKDAIPLAGFLVEPKEGAGGGDIHWNFTKFLVDTKGHSVARFEAQTEPSDPDFRVTLEQVLEGTYKKAEPSGKDTSNGAGDEDEDSE